MKTQTQGNWSKRDTLITMKRALDTHGFTQSWHDGGPPFPPRDLWDSMALGRGRVAYFEHADGVLSVLLDLPSLTWHVRNDNAQTMNRGIGLPHLQRALRALIGG